jgi:ferredoxin-NADP reductase
MIRTLLIKEPKSSITLYYANRTPDSVIFGDEIAVFEKKYAKNFRVEHFVSGNRLNEADIQKYVAKNPEFDAYIC